MLKTKAPFTAIPVFRPCIIPSFNLRNTALVLFLYSTFLFPAFGQTSVLTQHNDNSRTGQNVSETILNTTNVNTTQFGKLFAMPVNGQVYAQPLYVPGVTINGGVHNVVIIATEADSVYAYDADSTSSVLLWKASMVDAAHGAGSGETPLDSIATTGCTDLQPLIGITSTPVIDPVSKTIYVEAKSTDGVNYFHRLHALDLLTGNEKTPGPVLIAATVSGTGDGSTNGQLVFNSNSNALNEHNRAGLLLMNGTIYIAFASHCDTAHGWVFSYDAATFTRKSVYVTTPNGGLGGYWMGGAGVAADSSGNIFIASGNGDFDTTNVPAKETADTLVKLGTTNQILTQLDYFTPWEQATLQMDDRDLGSGGVLLLPDQPGTFPHILVQAGKEGIIYVINRDQMTTNNSHYCSGCTSDPEIIEESGFKAVGGMFTVPAYWNNTLYFWGSNSELTSIPITNGVPDFTHMTASLPQISFPGAGISISSNGSTAGTAIVWGIDGTQFGSPGPGPGPAVLYAYDATNVTSMLYSSAQNASRDAAGNAVKFAVPTVANGKVYVGTSTAVDVYGLLGSGLPSAATPVISPASETVTSPIQVTITDSTSGASIYYTTDNSTPSPTHGAHYISAFTLTSSAIVKAIAAATNFQNSAVASTSYTINSNPAAATPVIIPASESVSSPVQVTITDSTSGASIYYTTDNSTPSPTHGTKYASPFTLSSSATVKAIAAATNFQNSAVASATYTIGSNAINYSSGFTATGLTLSGSAAINGTRLRLTNTGGEEAGSGFFSTPVNIQSFVTDFSFQLTAPNGDGFTFAIHGGNVPGALGPAGGGLGYGPDSPSGTSGISKSIAVKFDLANNVSEGSDSTGVYTNGASPTIPAVDMTSSGVNLHSGDLFQVHMSYDGTNLAMTVTDVSTGKVFSHVFSNINIPTIVGGNTAYAGFTGGTGEFTAIQEIVTWTYSSGTPSASQAAVPQISPTAGNYTNSVTVTITDATAGSTITYTTDGSTPVAGSHGSTIASGGSFSLTSSATVKAIASASGFSPSNLATAAYTITAPPPQAAAPQISPVGGTYVGSVVVTIKDTTAGATITYTIDGSTPIPGSHGTAIASGESFTLTSNAEVSAIASASGFANSSVATAGYTVTMPSSVISFGSGFAGETTLTLNGGAAISGTRLRLTDNGGEARSAFNTAPVNVTQFTSDFTFQLTNANADGFTFTVQGVSPTALGFSGGGLGYGSDTPGGAPGIAKSLAIKFDLCNNAGEGIDSTGSYLNGASPTIPALDMTSSGVNLHSGDIFQVHLIYNGTTLAWLITDTTTAKSFSSSVNVNIPSTVGGNNAYVGFTAGTGGEWATQEILTWTYSTSPSGPIQFETEAAVVFNASVSSGPAYRVFAWTPFSGGLGTTLDGTAAGQFVTITLNVPSAGVYDVRYATKKYFGRGIVQLSINGVNIGSAEDQYAAVDAWQEFDLGNVTLAAGDQQFKFTTTGKNASSSGYTQAYDYIKLTRQ